MERESLGAATSFLARGNPAKAAEEESAAERESDAAGVEESEGDTAHLVAADAACCNDRTGATASPPGVRHAPGRSPQEKEEEEARERRPIAPRRRAVHG